MSEFKLKKVLVTGGSRGIGAACVRMFSEAGAEVAFTYNSGEKETEELLTKLPSPVRAFKVDLNSASAAEQEAARIVKETGSIDILINNAGIWKYGRAEDMTLEQWEETIRINLTGMFIFTRAAVPGMKAGKYGRIVNIASTAGQRGEPFYSHYASSKGGMISFTKSLAAELGEFNINTNCVAPGWVITDMTEGVFSDPEYREKVRLDIPVRRIAEPEDIAGPVLFLCSEAARHINGEILNVNGGSVLCG